ncbi:MAG TPA: M56 family metallopeptidase [Tepidisphaeraceae bacterium]|nr:M56 family metallopeptidase [Tepidisphaeraceae bacterium]
MISIFLDWLWRGSWQAAVLVALVILIGLLPAPLAIPSRWRTMLWLIVLLRLILPLAPQSRFSLFRLPQFSHDNPAPAPLAAQSPLIWTISHDTLPERIAAPPPAAVPSSPPVALLLPTVFTLWLAGVMLLTARLIYTNAIFRRRIARSSCRPDPSTLDLLNQCCRRLRIRRPPRLRITDAVALPALTGLVRPCLLLPPHLVATLSPAELRLIFLHELAHLKSHDIPVDWLWMSAQIVHWFNPIVWLSRRLYVSDRELARDAAVLSITGPTDAQRYGQALLQLAAHPPIVKWGRAVVGILDGKQNLRRRITLIAQFDSKPRWSPIGMLATIALACTGLTAPAAQPSSATTTSSSPLVMRVYDVRDVLRGMESDRPSSAPLAGLPATTTTFRGVTFNFPVTAPIGAARVMDQLTKLIQTRIAPDSWHGSGATIQSLSRGELVITQTDENQRKISALLDEYRNTYDTMVCIQARFLSLNAVSLAKLPEPLRQSLSAKDKAPALFLSPDQLKTLLNAASADGSVLSAPRVTLFNCEQCSVAVLQRTPYVVALTVAKGGTTYVPRIDDATAGDRLELHAMISSDHKCTILKADCTLSRLDGFVSSPFVAPDGSNPGTVQTPRMSITRWESDASVPDGGTILLGAPHPALLRNYQTVDLLLTPQILPPRGAATSP